ncbi:SA1362 family protein [Bacillus haikouensis]|uniref:SA1362 family protein n=1 Tax=Bacillus haikouensis TaxID=1510468 RepID=UPI0028B03000|nr:SA1362 family protein [Bacillus haikouensis]
MALLNARNIMVLTLTVLAFVGLGSWLIGNPLGLLRNILITAAVIGIIFFIYRRWFSNRSGAGSNEQRAFLKAAKQSKKRLKRKSTVKTQKSTVSPLSKKRSTRKKSNANLTVIEGKKNKKSNRASF